jgi:hypothetical protein
MPITVDAAVAAGWTPMSGTPTCVSGLGVQYVQSVGNNNAEKPLSLYFTDMGQLAGVGVFALGDSKTNLIKNGFWIADGTLEGKKRYSISVSFRKAEDMCSGTSSALPFGDQLIVNANGIGYHLPMTSTAAQQVPMCPTQTKLLVNRSLKYNNVVSAESFSFFFSRANRANLALRSMFMSNMCVLILIRFYFQSGWYKGSCFAAMGTHWFKDISG